MAGSLVDIHWQRKLHSRWVLPFKSVATAVSVWYVLRLYLHLQIERQTVIQSVNQTQSLTDARVVAFQNFSKKQNLKGQPISVAKLKAVIPVCTFPTVSLLMIRLGQVWWSTCLQDPLRMHARRLGNFTDGVFITAMFGLVAIIAIWQRARIFLFFSRTDRSWFSWCWCMEFFGCWCWRPELSIGASECLPLLLITVFVPKPSITGLSAQTNANG